MCENLTTLEDAIKYFGLSSDFEKLDKSLEDVRRRVKSKEEHEMHFKNFDKTVKGLSLKYHPDKKKTDTDGETSEAQNLQTAINEIRRCLSFLNRILLENIDFDHKYGDYAKLNISSVGNLDELDTQDNDVLLKIKATSKIRQQSIITKIGSFLAESQNCIKSYTENDIIDFESHFDSAMSCMESCIKGYEKLLEEYETTEKDCSMKIEKILKTIIRKTKRDSLRQLKSIKHLRNIVKVSMEGQFHKLQDLMEICSMEDYSMDDYFVMPFMHYVKLMALCKIVKQTEVESKWTKMSRNFFSVMKSSILSEDFDKLVQVSKEVSFLNFAYCLASYYRGNNQYKKAASNIMRKENASPNEIKENFVTHVKEINMLLGHKYKVENYERTIDDCVEENSIRNPININADLNIEEMREDIQSIKNEVDQITKNGAELRNEVEVEIERSQNLRKEICRKLQIEDS